MSEPSKIYFASDLHLGAPNKTKSREREELFIQWLNVIEKDAAALYLVGDVFDFWFEYGTVVPKGHVRLLGKLAALSDSGVEIHYFTGNHDIWTFGYLAEEIGMTVHYNPIEREWNGKRFFIGHGDGLGPGDYGYKRLKKLFQSRLCQWMFKWIHPDIGIRIASFFSNHSRDNQPEFERNYLGDENEWLVQYSKRKLEQEHFDYFIFGHRHLALDIELNENSRYINLGDWIRFTSYAVFDGQDLRLDYFSANPQSELESSGE